MLENRNLKRDLFAIGLLAGVAFLGVSLATYHPADPVQPPIAPLDQIYAPDQLVYPAHESVTNLCGNSGALVADAMLTSLGIGAYFVVASLAWVDVILLRRQGLQTPWIRSTGWLLTLIGLTTCLSLLVPSWSPGPIVGPGGYLGALVGGLLKTQFAAFGAIILSCSVLACGLLLYTDYAILRIGKLMITFGFVGAIAVQERWQARRESRRSFAITDDVDASDTEEEEAEVEEEEEYSEPAIKISGRPSQPAAAEADDEEEAEECEEEDIDAEADDEELEEGEEEWEEEGDAAEEEDDLVVKAHKTKKPAPPKTVHQQPHFKVKKPEKNERDVVMHQLNEASRGEMAQEYELPSIELLHDTEDFCFDEQEKEVRAKAKILEKTFAEFGFKVRVVEIETGPVIAQYEIQLEAGLRLSKITGLADDLAIALRVPSVRIVAPIPGKNTVGIEVPNETRQVVRLREVMELSEQTTKKMKIPLFLGKDVSGNALCADLASLPHLLIAGRTGTGKSVCLNAIISSILMTRRPDEVRMLMIDPKMVELSGYGRLPHLMHPVVTDMKKAEAILAWAVEKMEERYALLAKAGVRHITTYNQLGEEELIKRLQPEDDDERAAIPLHLPFIVIVADEMADLMMTAGKEVEQHIIRLAQKSRAVGIHLILATQKPTVDVITGLIKSNLPARIAFQVASRTDSRVVLDEMGADKLLGNGDMLFLWPGTSTLLRGQGTYLGDDEIDAITNEVSQGEQYFVNELVNLKVEANDEDAEDRFAQLKKRDELYESAIDIVVREGRGSVSLLQRALGIGYGRAARLIDFMAEDNIVGPYAGSQAREVLVSIEEWQTMQGLASKPPAPPKPARTNVIVPDLDEEEDDEDLEDDFLADDGDVDDLADDDGEEEDVDDEEAEDDEAEDEDESSDLLDEVDDEVDAEDDDSEESDADDEAFVPPPKSRTALRRRGRTIRPHGDDESDDPFPTPDWNESNGTGSRSRGRRKSTRRAVSQVAAAPWEDEAASDWSIDTGEQADNDHVDEEAVFPTAIDTTRRRTPRSTHQSNHRLDARDFSQAKVSSDADDDGPRIVMGGRRRRGSAKNSSVSSRATMTSTPSEALWNDEEDRHAELTELDREAYDEFESDEVESDEVGVEEDPEEGYDEPIDENDTEEEDADDEYEEDEIDDEADDEEYDYEYDEEEVDEASDEEESEDELEDEAEDEEDEYEYEYEEEGEYDEDEELEEDADEDEEYDEEEEDDEDEEELG